MFLFGLCVGMLTVMCFESMFVFIGLISWILKDLPEEEELQDLTMMRSIHWENSIEKN